MLNSEHSASILSHLYACRRTSCASATTRCAADRSDTHAAPSAGSAGQASCVGLPQFLVEDHRVMRRSVRIEGVPGIVPAAVHPMFRYNFSAASPRFVSSVRRRNPARRAMSSMSASVACPDQCDDSGDVPATSQSPRDGVVRCPGRVELHGANNSLGIASDEEDCTGVGGSNGPSPPVLSGSTVRGARKLTAAPDPTASTRSRGEARRSATHRKN